MKARRLPQILIVLLILIFAIAAAEPPTSFDLRDVDGENYVTSIKSQSGGTCWAFGAYAPIEGNLMISGLWTVAGDTGEPDLAEYHLDWWNGFNNFFNADDDSPPSGGVEVHWGGNYHMTSAYLSRGEGAVRNIDGQSFSTPPDRFSDDYHYYYVRDMEWYTVGENLANINLIKQKVMEDGGVATCLTADVQFLSANYVHYQPPDDGTPLNHAVCIIGWDDNKITQAPNPGAWLCKNSWGSGWGLNGYFWISYFDKYCGRHPTLGAVAFRNVEPMRYDHVYYHDYHGWVSSFTQISEAFNAYTAETNELLGAVNFVTSAHDVDYKVVIYGQFDGTALYDSMTGASGHIDYKGFHTVELERKLELKTGDNFYIYLYLSQGGPGYDRTGRSHTLVGGSYRGQVISIAEPGQSYYYEDGVWKDLTDFNNTANFCIKGLTSRFAVIDDNAPQGNVNSPYEFNFDAVGGTEPYHWQFINGQLPYGCAFEGDTIGRIVGVPTWAATFNFEVFMEDSSDPPNQDTARYSIKINPALPVCGDANGDLNVDVSDPVYLTNYIFMGGDPPDPVECGEVNCDDKINLVDVVYLINYVFNSGTAPCDPDDDGATECLPY